MTNSFPTRRSSDLTTPDQPEDATRLLAEAHGHKFTETEDGYQVHSVVTHVFDREGRWRANFHGLRFEPTNLVRSEEHTSELQSLMRISYAVFCSTKKHNAQSNTLSRTHSHK